MKSISPHPVHDHGESTQGWEAIVRRRKRQPESIARTEVRPGPMAVEDGAAVGDALARTTDAHAPLANVVAIVGCDGSGKTRLARDLFATLRQSRPTQHRYMGLVSGETGDKIKKLPLLGVPLERHLAAKSRRAQDMTKRLPGMATAVVMYLLSVWRVSKVSQLVRSARSGILVIAERYPQAEIAGFNYDGPGISKARSENWIIRALAAREIRLYQWMAEQIPTIVLRLNVDATTAFSRKADHPMAELIDKIAHVPLIGYNNATIIDIDARMPYDRVLSSALHAIHEAIPGR